MINREKVRRKEKGDVREKNFTFTNLRKNEGVKEIICIDIKYTYKIEKVKFITKSGFILNL